MSLIKCNNIEFKYDGKEILKNISFEVNKGDYLCIIGENGSGKSTLLNIISGVLKPNNGTVTLDSNLSKKEIGYLPQKSEIYENFPASVYEVVISGCVNKLSIIPFCRRKEKQIANYNMNLLEISNIKNKCFHELSGGQKQRVLLARTLCSTRDIILLDEPVSGLDPIITESFYNVVNHLNNEHGTTVVMVSHDIQNCFKYASHILYIGKELFYYGSKSDFLNSEFSKNIRGNQIV